MAVVKGQRFQQAGPSFVSLSEPDESGGQGALVFEAFVEGTGSDSISSGTVGIPGGGSVPLVREEPQDTGLRHEFAAEELVDLNLARPSGSYTLNLATKHDGNQTVTLSLSGDTYPPVPRVVNFAALQSVDAAGPVTVQWTAFTGGGSGDFVQLTLRSEESGTVFESKGPGEPRSLDGTATQATIPAGTLQPGQSYRAEVMFVKVTAFSSAYAPAVAGYFKLVEFDVHTAAGPGNPTGAALDSVIPGANGGALPRNSAVTFRFTKPMNPAFHSITWTGVEPAGFIYEWRDGNTVLLCRHQSLLPAQAEIAWTLNGSGFRDSANFPLSGNRTGGFTTASEVPASAPDVAGFYLVKMQGFRQTGAAPAATGMFGCDAVVEMDAFNRVKPPALLTVAAGGSSGRLRFSSDEAAAESEHTFASRTDMDRFFPNGNFTFGLTTLADGDRNLTLSLGSQDDYPPAPSVINLNALQSIEASAPVTISWGALSGWSREMSPGSGVIELEIENDQGMEVLWIDNEELNSASGVVIPAGALWPGRTYRCYLTFFRVKDVDSSYGSRGGAAGFGCETAFTIRTAGTPVLPKLEVQPAGPGMDLAAAGGEPLRHYLLEASTDLTSWHPLTQLWQGEEGLFQFYDDDAHYLRARHYRLRDFNGEPWARHVTIQGTVWTSPSRTVPAAGAVVGTSLDARTAVTDSQGRFFLEMVTPGADGSRQYTIQITAGAVSKAFGPWNWGDQPREQHFEMQ